MKKSDASFRLVFLSISHTKKWTENTKMRNNNDSMWIIARALNVRRKINTNCTGSHIYGVVFVSLSLCVYVLRRLYDANKHLKSTTQLLLLFDLMPINVSDTRWESVNKVAHTQSVILNKHIPRCR